MRRPTLLAIAFLLLWPALLLGPCLFGPRTFVPYDLAQFPPAGLQLAADELAATRAGSNYDVTEIPVWFAPELALAQQTLLEQGDLPGWNPFARNGTALLAHGLDGILYPPNWLAMLRQDPAQGLGWLCWLNFSIAGLLAFGLLRELGCTRLGALLGAVLFAASGTALANGHFYMRLASLVWLPGLLWTALRAAGRQGRAMLPPLGAFAVCLAMTWLAGFPPYSAACTLVAGGFVAWLAAGALVRRDGRRAGGLLLAFGAATAVGMLLCAAHLLPVLQFFPDSARPPDPDLARVSHAVFDGYGFLGYLVPDLFGRPDLGPLLPYDRSPLALLLGARTEYGGAMLLPNFNSTEYAVFAGSLAVVLVPLGALGGRGRHRGFALLALLLLWGLAAFAWPLLHLFALPGVKTVPPFRFLGPASLMVAWLAAVGLDALRQRDRPWLPAAAAALGLLCCGLAWWFGHRLAVPDVFAQWELPQRVAARYAHLGEPGAITPDYVQNVYLRSAGGGIDYAEQGRLRALAALGPMPLWYFVAALLLGAFGLRFRRHHWGTALSGAAVVLSLLQLATLRDPYVAGKELRHAAWTPVHDWLVQQRQRLADQGGLLVARAAATPGLPVELPPGTLQPHGIRDLQVYTYFDRWSARPLAALFGAGAADKGYVEQSLPDDERLRHPLLDLLGVRYLLSVGSAPLQHAGAVVGPDFAGPGGRFFVQERTTALPRAFVVPRLRSVADEDAAVAALVDPAFRPRDHALVVGAPDTGPGDGAAAGRAVRFELDRNNRVELAVADGPAGFLVLADTLLPGWRVAVDGTDVELLRVNLAMRGVAIPAGACRVAFTYRTPGFRPGLVLSGLAAAALALGWWWSRRRGPA